MANTNIIQITKDNFKKEVENSEAPVLLDFWAQWCGPCRSLAPILDELADKYSEKIKVGKINVDEESDLAVKFRVASIPTLMVFKNGQKVQQIIGLRSVKDLEDMINDVL